MNPNEIPWQNWEWEESIVKEVWKLGEKWNENNNLTEAQLKLKDTEKDLLDKLSWIDGGKEFLWKYWKSLNKMVKELSNIENPDEEDKAEIQSLEKKLLFTSPPISQLSAISFFSTHVYTHTIIYGFQW